MSTSLSFRTPLSDTLPEIGYQTVNTADPSSDPLSATDAILTNM